MYVMDRFAVPIGIYRQWQESGIHHFDIYHSLNTDSRIWASDDQCKKAKLIPELKLTPILLNDAKNRKWSYQAIYSFYLLCFQCPQYFLEIWDLPEDEVLKRIIYGHRFWANKYSINTISYYIPPRDLESVDQLGTLRVGDRLYQYAQPVSDLSSELILNGLL